MYEMFICIKITLFLNISQVFMHQWLLYTCVKDNLNSSEILLCNFEQRLKDVCKSPCLYDNYIRSKSRSILYLQFDICHVTLREIDSESYNPNLYDNYTFPIVWHQMNSVWLQNY